MVKVCLEQSEIKVLHHTVLQLVQGLFLTLTTCVWAPCFVASKFSRNPASNFSNLLFVIECVLICICASSAARATLSSNLLRIFCSLNNSFYLKREKLNATFKISLNTFIYEQHTSRLTPFQWVKITSLNV